MANSQIQSLTIDGITYDIVDNTSGYALLASPALTGTPTAPTASSGDSSTKIATTAFVQNAMSGAGAGTVTSVGISNATNGGLSVSGSPITSSGTVTIGHTNVLNSAQTTRAVYPIKIDKNGHISEYGSAVTIPVVPDNTGSATTGISIADHSTDSIYGVSSSTTSVYGVSTSTTTASKVTVGSHSTDYGVKSAGSASSWTFESKTIPNVTAVGSGSASLTFTMDTTDTKKLKIAFSHTHTAPTLGTAITVQSKSGGSNGSAPTLGSKVPTVSASDVTVPIKNADATTVPIKNVSATTVVISATHSVTDNGHTHTI